MQNYGVALEDGRVPAVWLIAKLRNWWYL